MSIAAKCTCCKSAYCTGGEGCHNTPSNFIDGQGGEGKAELLPCPFCGGEGQPFRTGGVYCGRCGSQAFSVKDWNFRLPESLLSQLTAAKEENERLKKEAEVNSVLLDEYDKSEDKTIMQSAEITALKAEADALRRELADLKQGVRDAIKAAIPGYATHSMCADLGKLL